MGPDWLLIIVCGFFTMLFGGWSVIAASYGIASLAWACFSVATMFGAGCYMNYKG